jgi:hypothetical protein
MVLPQIRGPRFTKKSFRNAKEFARHRRRHGGRTRFHAARKPLQEPAGGTPSTTEAYYSFDFANVHFMCLDSYESSRAPTTKIVPARR